MIHQVSGGDVEGKLSFPGLEHKPSSTNLKREGAQSYFQ